jgi:hypothetical protein
MASDMKWRLVLFGPEIEKGQLLRNGRWRGLV